MRARYATRPFRSAASTLAACLCLLATAAAAQPPAAQPRSTDTIGTYVVRKGDTLEEITERFLGDPGLWPDNWELNPWIVNPHLLQPGQELRIILDRKLPPSTAKVSSVTRVVEKRPVPNPWTDARRGDLLEEDYGLRTGRRSSAEVELDDDTTLQLSELSLIFLERVGTSLRGVKQDAIEIVEGQADLTAAPIPGRRAEIELIVGGASARPRTVSGQSAETRARLADSGDAQLMVFSGASQVEAGGQAVEVGKGMGTKVVEGEPPSPPEPLLPAPRAVAPARGSTWQYADPEFAWRPVTRAAGYTVEVCWDAECTQLVERAVGLDKPRWQPERLPRGTLYWRANAVSVSGLDGYSSRALPFQIDSDRVDRNPPVVVAIPVGAIRHVAGNWLVTGASAAIRLEARDDASGVREIRYRWNSEPWALWEDKAIAIPRNQKENRFEFQATDRLGKASQIWWVGIGPPPQLAAPPEVHADPGVVPLPPDE